MSAAAPLSVALVLGSRELQATDAAERWALAEVAGWVAGFGRRPDLVLTADGRGCGSIVRRYATGGRLRFDVWTLRGEVLTRVDVRRWWHGEVPDDPRWPLGRRHRPQGPPRHDRARMPGGLRAARRRRRRPRPQPQRLTRRRPRTVSKKSDKSPEKKPRAKKGEKPAKETAPKARKGKGVEQQPPEQPPQPPPPAPAGAAFRALPAGLPWVRVEADRGAAWERLTREQLERLSPFDAGDVIAWGPYPRGAPRVDGVVRLLRVFGVECRVVPCDAPDLTARMLGEAATAPPLGLEAGGVAGIDGKARGAGVAGRCVRAEVALLYVDDGGEGRRVGEVRQEFAPRPAILDPAHYPEDAALLPAEAP